MGLVVYLEEMQLVEVYGKHITHNLVPMAKKAGLYKPLWEPASLKLKKARQLIPYLQKGIKALLANPDFYKQYDAVNGYGSYECLLQFAQEYLQACTEHPDSKIVVSP